MTIKRAMYPNMETDKKRGMIVEHQKHDIKGNLEQITYELKGGSLVPISIHLLYDLGLMEGVRVPKVITHFKPYKLVYIETHLVWQCAEYIVIKTPLYYMYPFFRKLLTFLDLFYRRCIFTLAVWQLAEYNMATIPSWRDIKLVIKLKDKFKKKDD